MLSQKQCLASVASKRHVRLPLLPSRRQTACSRRQQLAVVAQAQRMPAVEAVVKLEQGYTYVDVRTPEEFAAGRPVGSVNIPFLFKTAEGMQPNPDFLAAWQEAFPDTTTPLVVGCKSGNRSARACAVLSQAEYVDLVDNACGYDGWVAANLPVEK